MKSPRHKPGTVVTRFAGSNPTAAFPFNSTYSTEL